MDIEVFINIEEKPSTDKIRNEVLKEVVGTQDMSRELEVQYYRARSVKL